MKNDIETRCLIRLFIKPKAQERGTKCGKRVKCSQEFQGINIPGNPSKDSRNITKDSW